MGTQRLELLPRIHPRIDGGLGESPRKEWFIHNNIINLNLLACRSLLTLNMEKKETNQEIMFYENSCLRLDSPGKGMREVRLSRRRS